MVEEVLDLLLPQHIDPVGGCAEAVGAQEGEEAERHDAGRHPRDAPDGILLQTDRNDHGSHSVAMSFYSIIGRGGGVLSGEWTTRVNRSVLGRPGARGSVGGPIARGIH